MSLHQDSEDLAAVVIPLYKEIPSPGEEKALLQCLRIFKHRPIHLAYGESLNLHCYLKLQARAGAKPIGVHRFRDDDFTSIDSYNRLLLSPNFYQCFARHAYILIHQLDAFAFRDELDYWCDQAYDFIGAPWFEGFTHPTESFCGVGNGGFSLRKISAMLRILTGFRRWIPVRVLPGSRKTRDWLHFAHALIVGKDRLYSRPAEFPMNEDYFWGEVARKTYRWYRVPTPEIALRFSFEARPSYLYQLNQSRLPMGCHAWERYEPHFWANFIEASSDDRPGAASF